MLNQKLESDNKVSVALAGLGFGEKVHLKALSQNDCINTLAIWHPNKERLDVASGKHKIEAYQDWDALINNRELDGIIITTPPEPRYNLALRALEAGKHLLLEKPVALNSKEITELQKIAIKKKLIVAVDFEYRAVPHFMQLKKMLDNNAIGTPWLIKIDWLMSSRANKDREWNWYSEKEKGGGVLGALGTHAFDMLHWLFGPTISVNSLLSTSIKQRPYSLSKQLRPVTSADICLAQLEIDDIKSKSIVPAQVSLSAVSRQGRGCWIEVYGSEGSLMLGSDNQNDYVHGFKLWFSESNQKMHSINPDEEFSFNKTWDDGRVAPVRRIQNWWAKGIKNANPVIPGLSEGLESQKVCDKIIESNSTGLRKTINSSL